jgi:hypothetical protein
MKGVFLGQHGDGQFHGFAAIANFQAGRKIARNVVSRCVGQYSTGPQFPSLTHGLRQFFACRAAGRQDP